MFKVISIASALVLSLASPPSADASELELFPSAAPNRLQLLTEGDGNSLIIHQEHTGAGNTGNVLDISITGHRNGGPADASFGGLARQAGLQPGLVSQSGFDNSARLTVQGSDNIFAMVQQGSGNMLTAAITGSYNELAVIQSGYGNIASIVQNGIGNSISLTQRSW